MLSNEKRIEIIEGAISFYKNPSRPKGYGLCLYFKDYLQGLKLSEVFEVCHTSEVKTIKPDSQYLFVSHMPVSSFKSTDDRIEFLENQLKLIESEQLRKKLCLED